MQPSETATSTIIFDPATETASASASSSKSSHTVNGEPQTKTKTKANGSGSDVAPDDPNALENLVGVSVAFLRQAIVLVNESLAEDGQLTYVSKYIPGSTIGKHLRHARDHFALLLDSVDSASGAARHALSYDVRLRGTPMEGSRAAAAAALEECVARLARVDARADMDAPLTLKAVTPHVQTLSSSFGRELWFAALHAVHHWSMVRVIAGELDIQLEDSFGVAPSTIVHRGTEGGLGKSKI